MKTYSVKCTTTGANWLFGVQAENKKKAKERIIAYMQKIGWTTICCKITDVLEINSEKEPCLLKFELNGAK
jgi:hypothetical protein